MAIISAIVFLLGPTNLRQVLTALDKLLML